MPARISAPATTDARSDRGEDPARAVRAIEHRSADDHQQPREGERREHDDDRESDAAPEPGRLEVRQHGDAEPDQHEAE
jgi:hypothetical protein